MQVKLFSVGDERPLAKFISDNSIRITDIQVAGKLGSSKDFEVCLIFEQDTSKTTSNRFHRLPNFPDHVIETRLKNILARETVVNFRLAPYVTEQGRGYAVFWEEEGNPPEGAM